MIAGLCVSAGAEEKEPVKGLDMASDIVTAVFDKTNAFLQGNLVITMPADKPDTGQRFITNAIGQKVPASTAVKSAGSLHNDEAL